MVEDYHVPLLGIFYCKPSLVKSQQVCPFHYWQQLPIKIKMSLRNSPSAILSIVAVFLSPSICLYVCLFVRHTQSAIKEAKIRSPK